MSTTKKTSEKNSNRYLVYTKDLHKDEQTTLLPVIMVPFFIVSEKEVPLLNLKGFQRSL